MSIQEYIDNKRKIQSAILSFIDDDDDNEEETEIQYNEISTLLTVPTIHKDKEELKQIILIISNISDNHHRTANFFDKIGRIIEIIKEDLKSNFTNKELFTFFKNNKRTLLLLVEKNIITITNELFKKNFLLDIYDESKIEDIKKYFSPELGNFKKLGFPESIDKFLEYRDKGQNESYICEVIRQDAVVEFISHVNMGNISLSSEIKESIFETNSIFLNKRPLLIEYATFYGSIQIFQYIKMNKPNILNGDLWIYAIHSNKAEMIHALEENKIFPIDRTYEACLIESIKCHHNEIANYIRDSLFDRSKWNEKEYDEDDEDEDELGIYKSPVLYHNFEFMPDDFEGIFGLIFYLMQNKYSSLVKLLKDQTQFFFDINDYSVKYRNERFFVSFIVQKKSALKEFMITLYDVKDNVNELSRMMMCRYPPILSIKGFSSVGPNNEKNDSILTDYYEMTLSDYINQKKKGNYTKTNDYIIILGITIGLRYLHKIGIIHEVLYPGSILLDENLYPIIQKVEISKKLFITYLNQNNHIIHPSCYYVSPEQINGTRCQASNVFTYSHILYNLITLQDCYRKCPIYKVYNDIINGYRPDLQFINNKSITEFLEKCWCPDPKERLTFDQILDIITQEEFYAYFEPLDRQKVVEYLNKYGNEFDEIKNKFE